MKNKRTINENLREAASKRSRTLPSIVAASKTSLSRNFSRLPSTIDYLQESTKNLKTATKRDVKQAIDYSQGMIDWSRKGNIDLLSTSYVVGGANSAPVAVDDSVTTDYATSVLIDVLANDTDADMDTLSIQSVGTPSNGTAVIESGQIRYTPDVGFDGDDSFTYVVTDGTDTDTGTVNVTVNPYDFDQALEFDGSDDFVTLPTTLTSLNLTISFWFNIDASGIDVVIGSTTQTTSNVLIRTDNNQIWYGPSTLNNIFSFPAINTSAWYHCLIASNGTIVRCFLNGVESTTGSLTNVAAPAFDLLGRRGSGQFPFDGKLDDVLLTNTYPANPATASAAIYNGGAGADPLSVIPLAQQVYRFNGNADNDGSAGGSGTLNNFVADPYVASF